MDKENTMTPDEIDSIALTVLKYWPKTSETEIGLMKRRMLAATSLSFEDVLRILDEARLESETQIVPLKQLRRSLLKKSLNQSDHYLVCYCLHKSKGIRREVCVPCLTDEAAILRAVREYLQSCLVLYRNIWGDVSPYDFLIFIGEQNRSKYLAKINEIWRQRRETDGVSC